MRCWKYRFICLFFLLVQSTLFANETIKTYADSLRALEGLNRVDVIHRFSRLFRHQYPEEILDWNKDALKILEESGDDKRLAITWNNLGLSYTALKKVDKAPDCFRKSINLAHHAGYVEGESKACNNLGQYYYSVRQTNLALQYYQRAYNLAKSMANYPAMVNALYNLADMYYKANKPAIQLRYLKEAYDYSLIVNDVADVAYFSGTMGSTYFDMGDYYHSITWFDIARKAYVKLQMPIAEARILNNLGNAYQSTGSFDRSLDCYLQSLYIRQVKGTQADIANAYVGLGILYVKMGHFKKALEYTQTALQMYQKLNNKQEIAQLTSTLGVIYRNLDNEVMAVDSYKKSLQAFRELKDVKHEAQTLNNMGVFYLEKKRYQDALNCFLQSWEIKEHTADQSSLAITATNLGEIYLKLNQPDKAMEFFKYGSGMQATTQAPELRAKFYKGYSDFYAKKGEFQKALEFYKHYSDLQDSINVAKNTQRLMSLQIKHELSTKEKEIEILRRNTELQRQNLDKSKHLRNSQIAIILLILILMIVLYRRSRKLEKINRLLGESEKKLSELNQNLELRVEQEISIRLDQEQKAVHQAHLASLGELAAGIAHELNQPLHSLAFSLDNILLSISQNEADPEYMKTKLNILFEDISRMRSVIDHIRQFARQQNENLREPFDVNDVVFQAVSMIKEQYEKKGIGIDVKFMDSLPEITGNPYKLEQVILNLLINGRDALLEKYKEGGASIPALQVTLAQTESHILIQVRDEGIGMPKEVMDKAFLVFFTTKQPNKGTGLGLSISWGIVTEMGGTIRIESEIGLGTCMTIELPKPEEEPK